MYQSIYYNYKDYNYYLRDDNESWQKFQYKPTVYKLHSEGEFSTLDGKRCNVFKGQFEKGNPDIYEQDIDKNIAALIELYKDDDNTPSFHNIVYFDIEIEIQDTLTPEVIKAAEAPFTSIALYEDNTKLTYCYIIDKNNKLSEVSQNNEIIVPCKDEKDLILKFLSKWQEMDPTIIVGFNCDYFDLPYTYYRIKRVLGDKIANKLSPIGIIDISTFDTDCPIKYAGINNLDYLRLYKKYITKQQPSYKLGDIGLKEVGLGKIEYQGNLDVLFREDINGYIDYNIRDVKILVKLEEKLQFLDLTISTCHLAHVPYYDCYQQSKVLEGIILTGLRRDNIVCFNKPVTLDPSLRTKDLPYMGGFLLDPVPGLYRWCIDEDMGGLYPSLIISLNMSPETYIGRLVIKGGDRSKYSFEDIKQYPKDHIFTIEDKFYKKQKTITQSSLINYITKNKIAVACNGALYRTDFEGIIPKVLKQWQVQRDESKNLMKKYGKEGNDILYKRYNLLQKSYKLFLVSAYGAHGLPGWRFFNIASAEAITSSGQQLIQFSFNEISKHFEEYLPPEKRTNGNICIYSDTDSAYYELYPILKQLYPDIDSKSDQEMIKLCSDMALKAEHFINSNFKQYGKIKHNIPENRFNMKTECVLKSGLFTGKRRYAQYIVSKEGVPCDELDIKGLDLIKSNFPPLFKKFGEDIIKDIMFGHNKQQINKSILEFKLAIPNKSLKEIGKPTGVKQISSYISKPPKSGEIFSKLKLKCPINTKAAIYTNDLITFKKLNKKYPKFMPGDKMMYVYLKNNPYKIDVLGFNGYNDPPEIIDYIEKYVDKEKMFDSVLLNKLQGLFDDLKWGHINLNTHINKFFTFTK